MQSPRWKANNWEALKCLALQLLTWKVGARLGFLCCSYTGGSSTSLFLPLFQLLSCQCQKFSHSVLPSLFIKQPCEGGLLLFKVLRWFWWLVNSASRRKHVHIFVECQTSWTLSLLFLIFMPDSNLKECFKTFLCLGCFICPYARSSLWSSPSLNLGKQFTDGQSCRAPHEITTYVARRSGSWQRDDKEQFEPGHGRPLSWEKFYGWRVT